MADTEPLLPPWPRNRGAQPGTRLGPYVVTGALGRGGMGEVLAATDAAGNRVAVKLLTRPPDARARRRFEREGQLAAELDHPGIVRCVDQGDVSGKPYLVYELIDGVELGEACESLTRFERVELLLEVSQAVAHAHAKGVVHRDLKLANVLVDSQGRARVTDFGLATGQDLERLTLSGALVGTPAAMAPEQFNGDRSKLGPHTDVWALGVMLYELLVDQKPFSAPSVVELSAQILTSNVEPPRSVDPTVPRALEAVCLEALSRKPEDRYADAGELASALEDALQSPASGGADWPRTALFVLAPVALIVLAVAGGLALLRDAPPPAPDETPPTVASDPEPTPREPTPTETASGLIEQGKKHLDAGKVPEAEAAFLRAVELAPDQAAPHYWLGAARVAAGEHRAALESLDRALALDPDDAEICSARAVPLLRLGRFNEAQQAAERALTLDRDHPEAHNNLALVLMERGDSAGALRAFDAALELAESPDAYFNRAMLRFRQRDLAGSLRDLDRAVALDRSADLLFNRALVARELGDPDRARADLDAVLELAPDMALAWAERGRLRAEAGDVAGARADLQQSLAVDPDHPRAANVRRILARMDR